MHIYFQSKSWDGKKSFLIFKSTVNRGHNAYSQCRLVAKKCDGNVQRGGNMRTPLEAATLISPY